MNFLSAAWQPSRSNVAVLLVVGAVYALGSLLAQVEFATWANSQFSPIELSIWIAIFVGAIATINKFSATHAGDSQRRFWKLATIAIVSVTILQSADWFADTRKFWNSSGIEFLNSFMNATLAIIIAASIFWSTNLSKNYLWVARSLLAIVIFQVASILLETTQAGMISGYFHALPQASISTEFVELLCVEIYIVSLALTRVGEAKAAPMAKRINPRNGRFVGANARQAYYDCNLHKSARHPPIALAFYPGFQELGVLAAISWLVATSGPVIRRATGKGMTKQFWEMAQLWFRDGIDPPSYYALDLYEPSHFKNAPHYLTRFETKNGLFRALNKMRPNPHPGSEMNNKRLFADCCEKFGIPHAKVLAIVDSGNIEWHCQPEEIQADLFCKRQVGMGAVGTHEFRYLGSGRYVDADNKEFDIDGALNGLKPESFNCPILVHPWLRNHASIADLALDSLITFRVLTCLNETGEVEVTLAMLRLLAKLEPHWQHVPDEEYAAPIDLKTGELGLFTGDNMKTAHLRYENHLVTGAPIKGRILQEWRSISDVAIKAHRAFPHRLFVGWDIALTDHGPVVLEGNTNLDVMFLQRVHDAPIGESRFGELMNFHLHKLYGPRMAVWRG
jgi:Sugar-transfer associated ATP-grasp